MSPLRIGTQRQWKREDFATASFHLFLTEIDTFNLQDHGGNGFDAKQRMLSRAQAVGTVEAYGLEGARLYAQSTDTYLALLRESQKKIEIGGHSGKMDIRVDDEGIFFDTVYDPHQEEIRTVLVGSVLEHLEARHIQHMSFAVAVLAAVLGAIAVFK